MNPSPKSVRFDENSLWIDLSDGRVIAVPLAWFPRLLHATPEQQAKVELSPNGLHWDELEEDVSVVGLLIGIGDQSRQTVPATQEKSFSKVITTWPSKPAPSVCKSSSRRL